MPPTDTKRLVPVCVAGGAEESVVCTGLTPRVDSVGKPVCERCGTRLNRVKYTQPDGLGRACQKHFKGVKHPIKERATSSEPAKKKQRRTNSDPGQPMPIASTRLRVRAPKPPPPAPKPRLVKPTVDPVDLMALLDATHARRMALLEAEKNGAGSSVTNGSAVVWQ